MFILLILLGGGTYTAWYLNLLGPMMQMGNAAFVQGTEIVKEKLRDFLANSETAQRVLEVPMPATPARNNTDNISLDTLDSRGKKREDSAREEVDDI